MESLPLWQACRMRVVALALDEAGTVIREFARVDVTTDPASGCRMERVMRARYDPQSSRGPFEGKRLRAALENPSRADILVAAAPLALAALPAPYLQDVPRILVFAAWRRMLVTAPSGLLELCWHRGGVTFPSAGRNQGSLEHEVALLAEMLQAMLLLAPPQELVARSRGEG